MPHQDVCWSSKTRGSATSYKFRKACNSFDGETLVSTEHGLKPITSIKIGDKVWAYDEETGERSLQEVVHLIAGEGEKAIREITLATGEVLTATAGHPFYLPDSEQWVEAQELAEGDQLLTRYGDIVQIAALNTYFRPAKVYNLTVANDHTYFVGLEEVLAHNAQKVCDLNGIVIGATKPPLVRNPKHASGGAGKRSGHGAGLEPDDSKYAFERLYVKSSKNGNWYAKSPDGKSIYRYFESGGTVHWSGSTGDAMAPLDKSLIPPEIVKTFGFKVKGKNL